MISAPQRYNTQYFLQLLCKSFQFTCQCSRIEVLSWSFNFLAEVTQKDPWLHRAPVCYQRRAPPPFLISLWIWRYTWTYTLLISLFFFGNDIIHFKCFKSCKQITHRIPWSYTKIFLPLSTGYFSKLICIPPECGVPKFWPLIQTS